VFRRQFEIVAGNNCWAPRERATYLIVALQGGASDVLHGIPKGPNYEEILETLKDIFGGQHLDAKYRTQLKTRTQRVGESLQ
jgi:hypothetical protein